MSNSGTPTTSDFTSTQGLKRTKIVLLGDQSVGKTSLITRYAKVIQCRKRTPMNLNDCVCMLVLSLELPLSYFHFLVNDTQFHV